MTSEFELKRGERTDSHHVPVLLDEALNLLNIRSGLTYVDATAGAGGHTAAILDRLKNQTFTAGSGNPYVVAIDRDETAIDLLRQRFSKEVKILHGNYCDVKEVLSEIGINTVSGGVLADLGVSSMQIDSPERGFSFLKEGPLDMRMDTSQQLTAEKLINTAKEPELERILREYGEERFAKSIARAIVDRRPLTSTSQLAELVAGIYMWKTKQSKSKSRSRAHKATDISHPATRTFQAIRIAVNNELDCLKKFLQDCLTLLEPGARLVVISFHSLEDRLVKQILKEAATECLCPPRQPVCTCHHKKELLIITPKPVVAEEKEILANIRSRSAKLRAGEKL